jgi:hypothetical protein
LDAEDRNLRQEFLLRLKGFFDITESAAEIRGKSKGQVGTISFEVDGNRIFGQFNFCMVQATMHMSQLLENYVLEDPVQFTWSGIEGVTRRSVDGSGALVFSTTRTILGIFRKIKGIHDVQFEGRRKSPSEGSSGRDKVDSRKDWDNHRHGNSVAVSYNTPRSSR